MCHILPTGKESLPTPWAALYLPQAACVLPPQPATARQLLPGQGRQKDPCEARGATRHGVEQVPAVRCTVRSKMLSQHLLWNSMQDPLSPRRTQYSTSKWNKAPFLLLPHAFLPLPSPAPCPRLAPLGWPCCFQMSLLLQAVQLLLFLPEHSLAKSFKYKGVPKHPLPLHPLSSFSTLLLPS